MTHRDDFKKCIEDYFAKNLPNKFVADDNILLSFAVEHHLKLQAPDTHDAYGKRGVAVAYFLHQKVIPPTINEVQILNPYYHKHLYIPNIYGFDNAPTTSENEFDRFLVDLQKNKITGRVSSIPVRPTYDEIMAAWRQERLEDEKELRDLRLTHTDESRLR